jgi:uncharacterized protein (TIGR03083 family)
MHHELLAPLATDLEAIALHARSTAPVPTCPGWTVRDLALHAGRVVRLAASAVRGGDEGRLPRRPRPPEDVDPAEWLRVGSAELLEALGGAEAEAVVPTFTGTATPAWWLRRQAVEMAIHRLDAELALGRPGPIHPAVAAAGVDEFFDVVCTDWHPDALAGRDASVHLHAAEGGEWTATWAGGVVTWDRSHAKGDVAVRGEVADLLALLWGRPTAGPVEVLGNDALLSDLLAATAT